MDINGFLEIIKVELPESHSIINLDTKFRDLEEWDSLTGMSIIVVLEETYGVKISDSTFKDFNTFSDIFDFIKDNK
jgi:acyl carrier protein